MQKCFFGNPYLWLKSGIWLRSLGRSGLEGQDERKGNQRAVCVGVWKSNGHACNYSSRVCFSQPQHASIFCLYSKYPYDESFRVKRLTPWELVCSANAIFQDCFVILYLS